jgi:hypothetical protein
MSCTDECIILPDLVRYPGRTIGCSSPFFYIQDFFTWSLFGLEFFTGNLQVIYGNLHCKKVDVNYT